MKYFTFRSIIALVAVCIGFMNPANAQTRHDVTTVGSSAFNPAALIITVGDTVVWTNAGGVHNVNGTTATFASNPESFGGFSPSTTVGWPFTYVFTIAGSYGYQCDPHSGGMQGTISVQPPIATPCSELFISEYLEGASNNKALEIYNPTNAMIDLSNYYFLRDNNGGTTSTDTFQMNGMLAPADVYVIANPSADQYILDIADTTDATTFYNGNDCMRLVNVTTGEVVDQIGILGSNPSGSSWSISGTNGVTGATAEFDLVRDPSVNQGDTMWNTVVSTQWYVLDRANFNSLGYHNAEGCGSSVPAYLVEELKSLDANLAADSVGTIAKITGIVHNPDQGFNSSEFAMQDGTAGIWITGADPILGYSGATEGDVISVYGTVAFNNGVVQLSADSINFVKNSQLFNAEDTDTLNEYTEGRYVKLDSVRIINTPQTTFSITGGGVNFSIVTVQSDTFTMRVDRDYELAFNGNPVPSGLFNITGVGSQFDGSSPHNSGYQIFPSSYGDLEILTINAANVAFENTSANISEGAGSYNFFIAVSDTLPASATVDLVITGGSAVNGTDYTFADTTLTFGTTGIDTVNLSIAIIDNAVSSPARDITFSLRNANGVILGLDTNFVLNIIDDEIPVYTLDQLRGANTDGIADSIGVFCKTFGTVVGPDYGGNNATFTIQDATGAISLFQGGGFGFPVNPGDSVSIVGTVAQFNGLSQFSGPDSFNVISTGNPLPAPALVGTLDEFSESRLVRMNRVKLVDPTQWYNGGGSFNADFTNDIDTFQLRVDGDYALADVVTPPAGYFDIIGFGGQFDNSSPYEDGYQIFPRDTADFIPRFVPNLYTIGEVDNINANGEADSAGIYCELRGVVYGENLRASVNALQFTIMDEVNTNDGIVVYGNSSTLYTVNQSDVVQVFGTVEQVGGMLRFQADSLFVLLGSGTLKTPNVTVALTESSESNLMQLQDVTYINEGTWNAGANVPSFDVKFTNGTDTFLIRVDNDVDLFVDSLEPNTTDVYNVTGIGYQFDFTSPFNSNYVLMPRNIGDLNNQTVSSIRSLTSSIVKAYPNPTSGLVNLIFDNASAREVIVYDIIGNIVTSKTINSDVTTLDIANYPNGQYLIKAFNNEKVDVIKILKQ